MFHFIDVCAEYLAVCPYGKPTTCTYVTLYIAIIIMLYALFTFIIENSILFIIFFLVAMYFYFKETTKYYEEKIDEEKN